MNNAYKWWRKRCPSCGRKRSLERYGVSAPCEVWTGLSCARCRERDAKKQAEIRVADVRRRQNIIRCETCRQNRKVASFPVYPDGTRVSSCWKCFNVHDRRCKRCGAIRTSLYDFRSSRPDMNGRYCNDCRGALNEQRARISQSSGIPCRLIPHDLTEASLEHARLAHLIRKAARA